MKAGSKYDDFLLRSFKIKPDYMIQYNSSQLHWWRFFIAVISMYCAIMVPLELALLKDTLYQW